MAPIPLNALLVLTDMPRVSVRAVTYMPPGDGHATLAAERASTGGVP